MTAIELTKRFKAQLRATRQILAGHRAAELKDLRVISVYEAHEVKLKGRLEYLKGLQAGCVISIYEIDTKVTKVNAL
jgi:hypothetical protein